jgi:argininosuccinate synthase
MAKVACEIAAENKCDMILHTSNRSQNSLRRFNGALSSLGFQGSFGSPFDLSSVSREEKIETLKAAGIDMFNGRLHSSDSNLWGREFESGDLDDPENLVLPEQLYEWTARTAVEPQCNLSIEFHDGVPVGLDGAGSAVLPIVERLNAIGGMYRLGRFEGLEEIEGGIKVQEVREMPAAHVLLDAYRKLEAGCLSAECIMEKMHVEQLWVREAVEGRWYGPLRSAAQAFIQSLAKNVTGEVSYELSSRHLQVTSVRAARPLYIRDRTQYEQTPGA